MDEWKLWYIFKDTMFKNRVLKIGSNINIPRYVKHFNAKYHVYASWDHTRHCPSEHKLPTGQASWSPHLQAVSSTFPSEHINRHFPSEQKWPTWQASSSDSSSPHLQAVSTSPSEHLNQENKLNALMHPKFHQLHFQFEEATSAYTTIY